MGPQGSGQGSQRRGVWEPLPAILYGYAIHPLTTGPGTSTEEDALKLNGAGKEDPDAAANEMIVALDVGDDVYAFERYAPKGKEVDGVWYRG